MFCGSHQSGDVTPVTAAEIAGVDNGGLSISKLVSK